MKKKIKIICSNYYSLISNEMIKIARKELSKYDCKIIEVPGCFEIPYMIAKSLKEDKSENLNNIDGYIVPKNDEFFSEYANPDRLKTISNFTGSAGMAIVLLEKSYLFVVLN